MSLFRKARITALVFLLTATVSCALLFACSQERNHEGSVSEPVFTDSQGQQMEGWAYESDCLSCHVDEASSLSGGDSAVAVHSEQGLTCVQCHSDAEALSEVHQGTSVDSKMPDKPKKTNIKSSFCISCHGDVSSSIEGTMLTDRNGFSISPHDAQLTERHDGIECVSCHSMHKGIDVVEKSKQLCVGCHHEGIYECGGCHEI